MIECSCGATYTLERFRELDRRGEVLFDEAPERLEMAACSVCKSHKAIWTDRAGTPYAPESIGEDGRLIA